MANFVALIDSDEIRRAAFIERIKPLISPIPGLVVSRAGAGAFTVLWAAGERAPVSVAGDGAVETSVLWGDAFSGGARIDAAGLARNWGPLSEGRPAGQLDGYHAGVVFRDGAGLVAGTDLLGLFPLYYAAASGVVLVGSSPALLHMHPALAAELDDEGLAGILLLGGAFRGRTLIRGIQRLGPGMILVAAADSAPAEVSYYSMPDGVTLGTARERDRTAALHEAYAGAIARQVPSGERTGFLLSGGRDSRLFAGYLHDRGIPVDALTFGRTTDLDAECAGAVARSLGFGQATRSLDPELMPDAARKQSHWEQLATGFATVHMWSVLDAVAALPPRVVTGYFGDIFFSGRRIAPPGPPFGIIFPRLNMRGVPLDRLRPLFGRGSGPDPVDTIINRLRADYAATAPVPLERGVRYLVANGERWHSGSVPWRLTFASWPVLPSLDRDVLDTIAALPPESLADRWVQDAILTTRFPALARLPLEGNGPNAEPLVRPFGNRMLGRMRAGPGRWVLAPVQGGGPAVERRYFHRVYNFNGPGWVAVRRAAEPNRDRLAGLFDMDVLARYLPGPDAPIAYDEPLWESAGHKLLVGLMLWAADHLP